ncbi:MAG: TRAP transporter small permease subunit [Rhodobacteraceae bacterium]|jgi:TRAP-type mannitol/chloroaromatic compound transport system permease small subunit|nr:TRAP transporter small permease subunit [Paracoccaceae bacterium]
MTYAATGQPATGASAFVLRLVAWGTVTVLAAFLVENHLMFWMGQGSARSVLTGGGGYLAAAAYAVAIVVAVILALRAASYRADSARITAIVAYLARGAFLAVLIAGTTDAVISAVRVEGLLPALVGEPMATQLGQANFRATYVHLPLVALSFVLALFLRGLGFIWLGLLVVVAQLLVVIGRFVFSYEQAFMADYIRMLYSALFLFASAYTLVEEGHVRVDVFYAGMSARGQALVNGFGSVALGMPLCWLILIIGMATPASVINGPILRFEQGQQGFGMFTKYFLAAFLMVFAVTMLLQFAAYLLRAAADWRGEPDPANPGRLAAHPSAAHPATGA